MSDALRELEDLSVKDSLIFSSRPFADRIYDIKSIIRWSDNAGNTLGKIDLSGYGELDFRDFEMLFDLGTITVRKLAYHGDLKEPSEEKPIEVRISEIESPADTCTCELSQVVNFGCRCGYFQKEQALKTSR